MDRTSYVCLCGDVCMYFASYEYTEMPVRKGTQSVPYGVPAICFNITTKLNKYDDQNMLHIINMIFSVVIIETYSIFCFNICLYLWNL